MRFLVAWILRRYIAISTTAVDLTFIDVSETAARACSAFDRSCFVAAKNAWCGWHANVWFDIILLASFGKEHLKIVWLVLAFVPTDFAHVAL